MGQDSAHSVSSFGRALKRPASVSLYTAIDTRRPKVRRTSFSSLAPSTPNLSDLDDENDDDEDGAYETSLRHFALRVEALQDSITLPPSGIALPGTTAQRVTAPDYRIALDFGTTYTTIAFAKKGEPQASIHTIDGFLEDRCLSLNGRQVPTESVYIRVPSKSATSLTKHRRKTSPVRFRRLHGWEAQRWLETPQPNEELIAHIRRMKLLLDNGTWTQDAKSDAQKQVARLKAHRLVHSERDIIQHILKYYLEHIRKTLARDYGFDNRSSVELTFCVPVCWTSMANAVMSDCIETAMRDSAFGLDRDESGDYSVNLFMVNEAEAGASYALASNASHATIKRKQVFLIIDCGGGTTDLGIYRTMEQHPLRLEREINPPSGSLAPWTTERNGC
ncbi:uncharacterized protein J4E79_007160 [Alternaria viburni]|uniref:uncharacterized protein n=1 Tax=Alternaria viburni TaxID=566460 RepID=UPI0020C1BBDF|nr:uncharacterized protein J4E79_007160 [Alternaria viburni]KAI4658178.1 hypothetical protein J4E79_007160 [Alternaria viburni]